MEPAVAYAIIAIVASPNGHSRVYQPPTFFEDLSACFRAASQINGEWRKQDVVGVATCRPSPEKTPQ